jgi:hypothetical protein
VVRVISLPCLLLHDFGIKESDKTQMKVLGFSHLLIQKKKKTAKWEDLRRVWIHKGQKCRIFTKNIDEYG